MSMTPSELRAKLESEWPLDATHWGQATDEIRDMSRATRETVGLPEDKAVDFRAIQTPSEWNTLGIASIVENYAQMGPAEQADFVEGWFGKGQE